MGFISILFALLIIGALYYFLIKPKGPAPDESDRKFLKDSGVDTSDYKSVLNSTKQVLHNVKENQTEEPEN